MKRFIRKRFACDILRRSADGTPTAIRVRASDETIDKYDDIVVQDFDLSEYEKNPVVLWEHGIYDCIDPMFGIPIGFSSEVGVVNGALEATLNFVDEKASPLAPLIAQGFAQGSIRAVSIGFIWGESRMEKRGDKNVRILTKNRIVEISACAIGANPNATTIDLQKTLKTNRALRVTRKSTMEMTPEELQAFIAALAAKLGMDPATATPEAILAKLEESAKAAAETQEAVGAETPAEVPAKAASLALTVDSLKSVVATLQSQIKNAPQKSVKETVDAIVKKAIDEGTVLPAVADKTRAYGEKHGVKALIAHLDLKSTGVLNVRASETPEAASGEAPKAGARNSDTPLTSEEKSVISQLNLSEEDLKKFGKKKVA